jgi:lauroyl/myristoyl acyltransferase
VDALTIAPPTPAPRWYTHGLNRVAVYRAAALAAGALPRRPRLRAAETLAGLLAGRFAAERDIVRRNLARVVPEADAAARARLVAEVFRHFAVCFADLITSNRRRSGIAHLLAGIEGQGHVDAAGRDGKGMIILTAHLGNWELAGRLLALREARPTHVVVAAEVDPSVQRFLRDGEAPVRFVTRTHPTSALPLLSALRRGEVVALQGDRALGTRGDAPVDFFGAPALFPLGPFVLARASGAAIVPAFCVLGADRLYTVRLHEPIRVSAEGEYQGLERWVRVLEDSVRRHPEQWFNFFDVWGAAPAH